MVSNYLPKSKFKYTNVTKHYINILDGKLALKLKCYEGKFEKI